MKYSSTPDLTHCKVTSQVVRMLQVELKIVKSECIGHVEKKLGARLWNTKENKKAKETRKING